MTKLELFNSLQKIWIKLDDAKKLVDDGKEVLCSNRLQGGMTNLSVVIEAIASEIKEERQNELVQTSGDG